jgi:hypothetical protein
MSLPDPTAQQQAESIPGIKLSNLIYIYIYIYNALYYKRNYFAPNSRKVSSSLRDPTVFQNVKIRIITFRKCMGIKSTASL